MGITSTPLTPTPTPSTSSSNRQPSIPISSSAAAQANLVHIVHNNLKNQHRWENLRVHTSSLSTSSLHSSSSSTFSTSSPSSSRSTIRASTASSASSHRQSTTFFPRPIITGRPPTRIYVPPDEDAAKQQAAEVEEEWVLPTDLKEKWSVARMAAVFDAIPDVEEEEEVDIDDEEEEGEGGSEGEGRRRNGDAGTENAEVVEVREVDGKKKRIVRRKKGKRILMAAVAEDSTVVYYLIHDGVVKPRQN